LLFEDSGLNIVAPSHTGEASDRDADGGGRETQGEDQGSGEDDLIYGGRAQALDVTGLSFPVDIGDDNVPGSVLCSTEHFDVHSP
jgi:hypothetical protein